MEVIKELTKQQFEEMKRNALKPPRCHMCQRNPDMIITLNEYGKRKIVVECKHCSSKVEVAIPTEIFSNNGTLLTIETEKGLAKAITEVLNDWNSRTCEYKTSCEFREDLKMTKQHFDDFFQLEEMISPMQGDINTVLTIQNSMSQHFFDKYAYLNNWKDGILPLTHEDVDSIVVYMDVVLDYANKLKEKIANFDKFVTDVFDRQEKESD